ncbi:MAG: glycosyltransferase family 87 protein [Pseudomonadota bacterium]
MSRQDGVVYAACMLLSVAAALVLGKDLNWDQLSYHFYAGYSAVEPRFGSDYFAGSAQGYLNPYSHLPFFLMVREGLSPLIIMSVLALWHGLNLVLVYEITGLLYGAEARPHGLAVRLLAVFFAFANPVFLTELGSTFNEISTGVLILAGWFLLLRQFSAPRRGQTMLAGALIGAAVALKLTNLLFVAGALSLVLMAPGGSRHRVHALLLFALGGMLGAVLAGGWWAWQLWQHLGNPLFPLFNDVFRSPHYVQEALKHYRFIPDSAAQLLLKPFTMTLPEAGVHIETIAPDLRYAALTGLLGWYGLQLGRRGLGKLSAPGATPPQVAPRDWSFAAFTLSVLLSWAVWTLVSGNSRYFLPMGTLAAVLLAVLLGRCAGRPKLLMRVAGVLVLGQCFLIFSVPTPRWSAVAAGTAWFELDIPEQLKRQPTLHISLNVQPASFLVPFLAPGSGMMNPTGMFVVDENPTTRALMARHAGRIRVLQRFMQTDKVSKERMNIALVRFGLEADLGACLTIRFRNSRPVELRSPHQYFLSCATRPLPWSAQRVEAFKQTRRRASALFARMEALCPARFQPAGLVTESDGVDFWRTYSNTDTVLRHLGSQGRISYANLFTNRDHAELGPIALLEKELPPRSTLCPPLKR